MLVAVITASACGGDDSPESSTPEISISGDDGFVDLLLTSDDFDDISSLAGLAREVGTTAGIYEDPDPRAPCGAPVLFPATDAIATFSGTDITVLNLVGSDGGAEYIEAMRDDARPGCPDHTRETNIPGQNQTVTFLGEVRLPAVGDNRIALRSRIRTTADLEAVEVMISDGELHTAFLALGNPDSLALSDAEIVAIADRMAERIAKD